MIPVPSSSPHMGPHVFFTRAELAHIMWFVKRGRTPIELTELDKRIVHKIEHAFASSPKFLEPHQ